MNSYYLILLLAHSRYSVHVCWNEIDGAWFFSGENTLLKLRLFLTVRIVSVVVTYKGEESEKEIMEFWVLELEGNLFPHVQLRK